MKKNSAVAMLAVLLVTLLAGCSTSDASSQNPVAPTSSGTELSEDARLACKKVFQRVVSDAGSHLILLVDKTASVADMPFPEKLAADLAQASRADGSLSVIAVDGSGTAPTLLAKRVALSTPGERDRPSVADLAGFMPKCVQAVYVDQVAPKSSGTDLHQALALASELIRPKTTVWLLSDMLSNTGELVVDAETLALDGMGAGRQAAKKASIDLSGATLKVAGVANASSPLLSSHRMWTRDFARGLCQGWGANGCGDIALDPENPRRSAQGLPKDPLPPFPRVTLTSTGATCTFEVPAQLAFSGNSFQLGDGVDDLLAHPLNLLLDNSNATAVVVGHTASSPSLTAKELRTLSHARADAVRNYFTNRAVPSARIRATGVGDTEPRVEDIDPTTGRQIEKMAALERRVDVTITGGGPCSR